MGLEKDEHLQVRASGPGVTPWLVQPAQKRVELLDDAVKGSLGATAEELLPLPLSDAGERGCGLNFALMRTALHRPAARADRPDARAVQKL